MEHLPVTQPEQATQELVYNIPADPAERKAKIASLNTIIAEVKEARQKMSSMQQSYGVPHDALPEDLVEKASILIEPLELHLAALQEATPSVTITDQLKNKLKKFGSSLNF